jgi:hypothetical protein
MLWQCRVKVIYVVMINLPFFIEFQMEAFSYLYLELRRGSVMGNCQSFHVFSLSVMKIGPKAGPLFLNSLEAGDVTGFIRRNHFNFQTSPSGLDQVAPVSLVSSKPPPGGTAAGVTVSRFVDTVAPADSALFETG